MFHFADCHAHLDFPEFEDSLNEIVDSALNSGVGLVISTGTDFQSSIKSVKIAELFDSVYAVVGIHPHEAVNALNTDFDELNRIAAHPKVVAIGEMGLDYYGDKVSDREVQKGCFERLIRLALEVDKPVVVHSRAAEAEALELLLKYGVRKAYFHCFTGSSDIAMRIVDAGYYIGVTGIVTFNNDSNAKLVSALAIESLLTETDSPFLAPKPFRGKRNEPAMVKIIAEKVAALRPEVAKEVLYEVLWKNALSFFGVTNRLK